MVNLDETSFSPIVYTSTMFSANSIQMSEKHWI